MRWSDPTTPDLETDGGEGGRCGPRRVPWPELALLACALLISLAVIEGWLRHRGFGDPRAGDQIVGADHLNLSGYRSTSVKHASHGLWYLYNDRGYRGRTWETPKPPGTYRIAMFGDSYVFGVGVKEEETLPVQLESQLRRGGHGVEVINLGVPGHNTEQEAILAGRELPSAQPDLVIVVVISNDVDVMPWNPDPIETCGVPVTRRERLVHGLLSMSYAYRLFHRSFIEPGRQSNRWWVLQNENRFDDKSFSARCFSRSLSAIAGEARRAGAGTLVFFYPSFRPEWDSGVVPVVERVGDEIGGVARGLGLMFLDGTPFVTGHRFKDLIIDVPGDHHPNGRMHGIVAGNMARFIEAYWAGR